LFKFDKDNIPDAVIKSIQPYIDNEAFQPAAIAKVRSSLGLFLPCTHKKTTESVPPKNYGKLARNYSREAGNFLNPSVA